MNKEALNWWFAVFGAIFSYLVGGWDNIIQVLALFIILDIVTGVSSGAKENKISSKKGYKGFFKKCGIFVVVIVAHKLDEITNMSEPLFRTMSIYFYIANESTSILENLAKMGVKIPNFIIKKLEVMQKETNEGGKKNE